MPTMRNDKKILSSFLIPWIFVHSLQVYGNEKFDVRYTDEGSNVTLFCVGKKSDDVLWTFKRNTDFKDSTAAYNDNNNNDDVDEARIRNTNHGELIVFDATPVVDERLYTCADAESNDSIHSVKLVVRTRPSAVVNLAVDARSNFALVRWALFDDGGYNITGFNVSYRREKVEGVDEDWSAVEEVAADETSYTIYGLKSNTTYFFRVSAHNKLGSGPTVSCMAVTLPDGHNSSSDNSFDLSEAQSTHKEKSYIQIWMVAVGIFCFTFFIIILGISLLCFRNLGINKRRNSGFEILSGRYQSVDNEEFYPPNEEDEAMELVPHITLNPSFNIDMLEFIEASPGSRQNSIVNPSAVIPSTADGGNTGARRRDSRKSQQSNSPDQNEEDCAAPAIIHGLDKASEEINLVNTPAKRKFSSSVLKQNDSNGDSFTKRKGSSSNSNGTASGTNAHTLPNGSYGPI